MSVQVRLARVALGTVDAGVRPDAAVGEHVLLQVELPAQAFATFRTGEGLLSCGATKHMGTVQQCKRNHGFKGPVCKNWPDL